MFFASFAVVRRRFHWIELGSGLLLAAVGVLVMLGRLTLLNSYLAFLNDWVHGLESLLR